MGRGPNELLPLPFEILFYLCYFVFNPFSSNVQVPKVTVVLLVPPGLIIKPLEKSEHRLLSCSSTLVELIDEVGSDDRHEKRVIVNREVMMKSSI